MVIYTTNHDIVVYLSFFLCNTLVSKYFYVSLQHKKRNMNINRSIIVLLFPLFVTGCNNHPNVQSDIVDNEVNAFAEAYFNYDFKTAANHCTPESEKWLRYAASNIHQADVDMLRNAPEGASIEINDYEYDDNDTTGVAIITVNDFMRLDTIGKAGHMIDKAVFRIPIILRDGKWTVKMVNLPRSEKPSRD